jgi:hypothetical protein
MFLRALICGIPLVQNLNAGWREAVAAAAIVDTA